MVRALITFCSYPHEYRSVAHACAKTVWLFFLLRELHCPVTTHIPMYCDNISTTYMVANPVFHARTKHTELDNHFVRKMVTSGTHRVQFIPSVDQMTDLFPKLFTSSAFSFYSPNSSIKDCHLSGGMSDSSHKSVRFSPIYTTHII